jgi:hypothetical protein
MQKVFELIHFYPEMQMISCKTHKRMTVPYFCDIVEHQNYSAHQEIPCIIYVVALPAEPFC